MGSFKKELFKSSKKNQAISIATGGTLLMTLFREVGFISEFAFETTTRTNSVVVDFVGSLVLWVFIVRPIFYTFRKS